MIQIDTDNYEILDQVAEKLTKFIQKREGLNEHDSQDFAYEILEFLGEED